VNAKQISDAIGKLDDEMLTETAKVRRKAGKQPKRPLKWVGIIAACACVVLTLFIWKTGSEKMGPGNSRSQSKEAETVSVAEDGIAHDVLPEKQSKENAESTGDSSVEFNYVIDEAVEINCSLTPKNGDIYTESISDYEEQLREVVKYVKTIDESFDTDQYRVSVINRGDDGAYTLELSYYIGDIISTDKGFNFVGENGILNYVSYNRYYKDGWPKVDEAELIDLVKTNQESEPLENIEGADYKKRDYYTFHYMTGELKRISEVFYYQNGVWKGNEEEQVLN
jgi:hypothetical protein